MCINGKLMANYMFKENQCFSGIATAILTSVSYSPAEVVFNFLAIRSL